jgi:hypothetical protein
MTEFKYSEDTSKKSNSEIVINCLNSERIFCYDKTFFTMMTERNNQAKKIGRKLFIECIKFTKGLTEVKFLKYKL